MFSPFLFILSNSYHNLALFMPLFNIPVSFGNLFQRIAPVDDWFYLSFPDQLI